MIKKALHIVLSLALSGLLFGETIGLYLSKDTCIPCGNTNISIELLTLETEPENPQCCSNNSSSCENTTECCSHNDTNHEHHKEHYYLTQTPTFFDKKEIQEFNISVSDLFLYLSFNPLVDEKHHSTTYHKKTPPLPSGSDYYRSLLCTYLI